MTKRQLKLVYSERDTEVEMSDFTLSLSSVLDRLWGFVIKLSGGNIADAEDIIQDTALKAFKSFEQLRSDLNFKSWIFKIAYHEYINSNRKSRVPFLDVPIEPSMIEDSSSWEEQIFTNKEGFGEELNIAVDELEDEFKEVVWLKYVEDFSYEEIAKILSISSGTVSSRLFRAKALLKERLWLFAQRNGWRVK